MSVKLKFWTSKNKAEIQIHKAWLMGVKTSKAYNDKDSVKFEGLLTEHQKLIDKL